MVDVPPLGPTKKKFGFYAITFIVAVWIGFLIVETVLTANPTIIARSQVLVAPIVVEGIPDFKQGAVTVIRAHKGQTKGKVIAVTNLNEAVFEEGVELRRKTLQLQFERDGLKKRIDSESRKHLAEVESKLSSLDAQSQDFEARKEAEKREFIFPLVLHSSGEYHLVAIPEDAGAPSDITDVNRYLHPIYPATEDVRRQLGPILQISQGESSGQ